MKIEMYTKIVCPYCVRAKNIFKSKGFDIIEYNIEEDPTKRSEMDARSKGARTVPQIFINDKLIGGCDNLMLLDSKGELDIILGIKK